MKNLTDSDTACAKLLDGFQLTSPVTFADMHDLREAIRAFSWTASPIIDVYSLDSFKSVIVEIVVGRRKIRRIYDVK